MRLKIVIEFDRKKKKEEDPEPEKIPSVDGFILHSAPHLPSPIPEPVVDPPVYDMAGYALDQDDDAEWRYGTYL